MDNHLPDYLAIGHVARDNIPGGAMLGGTCAYAVLTAHKLGQRSVGVTSYGPDLPSMVALDGIRIENVPHSCSTTFQNIYKDGKRTQEWTASARSISIEDVPLAWRKTPIVHLAPLAQEMSPAMCGDLKDSLVCVTMQGWLRAQDDEWRVIYRPHPELEAWLSKIDVMVLSLADVFGDQDAVNHLLTSARLGVETVGPKGCNVYHQGQVTHIPVKPETEVDPTGAGDIFAAAFFVRYHQTGDSIKAAQFANACASLSVRKMGMDSIPSLPEVEGRLAELYDS